MDQYRKKPVVVEAVQWNGHNNQEIEDFVKAALYVVGEENVTIKTLEGNMIAKPGSWIIKGVKGEFYPCAPDVFEATYEKVEAPNG